MNKSWSKSLHARYNWDMYQVPHFLAKIFLADRAPLTQYRWNTGHCLQRYSWYVVHRVFLNFFPWVAY